MTENLTSRSEDPIQVFEHQFAPHVAKRVVIVGLEPGGETVIAQTHSLADSNALGVTIVDASGSPAAIVSPPTSLSLFTLVNVGNGALATLAVANTARKRLIISRGSESEGTLKFGPDDTTSSTMGIDMPADGGVFSDGGHDVWKGDWYAYASGSDVGITVMEWE